MNFVNLEEICWPYNWHPHLRDVLHKPFMQSLRAFLNNRYQLGNTIYPDKENIFKAFELTSFADVKVVFVGQDPYHKPGQAHGLCFSVPLGQVAPPSLQNIYKELNRDYQFAIPNHGCLSSWAKQGILMLNSVLTVEQSKPASHKEQGWERFTDQVIHILNIETKNLIFALWGSYAHKKGELIDRTRHLVLKSTHPSPLSAYRGFLGCGHFTMINNYLKKIGKKQIQWDL